MKMSDMAEALALAAAVDNRTISELDVQVWTGIVEGALGADVNGRDVVLAVQAHYATSERRLMPAHVVDFVQKLRRVRKEQILPAYPPELADERGRPAAPNTFEPLMQWRAEALRLIANGQYQPDPPMPELLKAISQLSDEPQEPHSAARLWPAPPGWMFPEIPVPEIPPMLDPLASVPAELFDQQLRPAREHVRGGDPGAPCCCDWGAANAKKGSGEWPEGECIDCPVHGGGFGEHANRCRRHSSAPRPADPAPPASGPSAPECCASGSCEVCRG